MRSFQTHSLPRRGNPPSSYATVFQSHEKAARVLDIRQIPVLSDNYVYLVRETVSGATAVVDPAVAKPILAEAETLGMEDHAYSEHTPSWRSCRGETVKYGPPQGVKSSAPARTATGYPASKTEVGDGDTYIFGKAEATVFDVPGHTRGHIAYWFAGDDALFCGDTLFALGCGRVFEGTHPQMWASLNKLRALPDSARVFLRP